MLRLISLLMAVLIPTFAAAAGAKPQTLTPMTELQPAPDFTLQDMDGKRYRLSELRGKPVIVNFWATWCPPCREEMPSMQRAWERLEKQGVMMLAINIGESADTVFQFTANYPVEFPLLLDLDSGVLSQWPVRGLPATFVVDTQGRIAYRAIGGREWDDPQLLQPILKLRK